MRMAYHNGGAKSEQYQTAFGGYNHTENCSEMEFYEMKNMSSDLFPILAPRKKRETFTLAGSENGVKAILAKNKMCHVAGETFYIDNVPVENFNVEPMYDQDGKELKISLTSIGAYVIIFPQKLYVNTVDPNEKGLVEKRMKIYGGLFLTDADGTFFYNAERKYPKTKEEGEENGFYVSEIEIEDAKQTVFFVKTKNEWLQKEPCFGISNLYNANFPDTYGRADLTEFKKGTTVTVNGLNDLGLDGKQTVKNVNTEFIVGEIIIFKGYIPENSSLPDFVELVQEVPNMDFVIEHNNRLWGCRYGNSVDGEFVNEIYASAQGDFTLWNDFSGEASDSYALTVGSDGPFTGAVTYSDNPIFFKENCFHRIYGTLPENYQPQIYENDGLQKGSERSLAIVENVLFYKGTDGFYAYDGTVPQLISEPLGREMLYDAVCGGCDKKYYASVCDKSGRHNLYVYDVLKNLWHKEDNLRLLDCTSRGTELYCLTENGTIKISSVESQIDEDVSWYAQSGIIGKSSPDKKVIQKLKIRADVSPTAYVQVMIEYDSSGNFEPVFLMEGKQMQSFSIPIRIHRCDHFKILFMGRGSAKIYSLSKVIVKRSDK